LGALDTIWHLLNFVAPAVSMGAVVPLIAKLLWRRRLAAVRWQRLMAWSTGASLAALMAGLMVFGRDGRMVTYSGIVVASALGLWWAGLRKA